MATVDELTDPWFKAPPRGADLPEGDGEPMDSPRHRQQMNLLIDTLDDHWRDRDDVCVDGNMFIYFCELQAKKNDFRGPDVFVVMDTVRRERRSWVVWEENGRTPDLVIELTSPSTEHVDRGEKMRIYAQLLRVPEYYIYDPWSARLDAFELDGSTRTYRVRTPDADGRFSSRVTDLALGVVAGLHHGVEAPWLRWLTPDGMVLPTDTERLEREASRAERETARAEAALRRVAELEAQLGKG